MRSKKLDIKTSIINELQLLEDIISSPGQFNDICYLEALRSQSNFAYFSLSERNILSISLNTQKTYANEFLKLGYTHLNHLRSTAYQQLVDLKKSPPKATQESLKDKNLKLIKKIDKLEKQNIKLVKAFTDIQYTLISISKNTNDKQIKSFIEKKLRTFEVILSYTLEEASHE